MSRPVLLVTHAGLLGGAERVLLDWASALPAPVVLACPPGPLAAAAEAAGHEIGALPGRPLERRGRPVAAARDLAALARDVGRLARRHRPAAIVASGQRAILATAAAPLAGARWLALHHDLLPPGHGAPRLAGAALARASALADAEVATSRAIAAGLGPRTAVVHPGVDLAAWTPAPPPDGPPRALVLGALVAWKRPELALEIAARLPELHVDLAGEPLDAAARADLHPALERRAAAPDLAGRVRLLGRADAHKALASTHLLLHCADREPFGLALVEALAAGRPVVAPAAAGPLEIVTPACGRLYPPGDAGAAAAAVRAALADPAAPAAARRHAEAAFDGARAARTFSRIVAGLV